MAAPAPFDLKRAGLLIRDAATVLCGTLLVEFIMQQADCLDKRLKPVLEVLPGVEKELEGMECDWPRLVEDIKALLEACARFKAIAPAIGVCDYLEELYEPKKRAYNQLRSVKSAVFTRVRAVEEAAAATAAAVSRPAHEQVVAAQEVADLEATVMAVGSPATDDITVVEEDSVPAAVEHSGREASPTLPSAAANDPCQDNDDPNEKKAKKKKKKKAVKRELLFARPAYECLDEEVEEMEALSSREKAMVAELQKDSSHDQVETARLVLAASETFGHQASVALLQQQALTLETAGCCFYEAATGLANPQGASSAYIRAAVLRRKVLAAAPGDDFARWDLVQCDEEILESHSDDLDNRAYRLHVQEMVDLLRPLYKHRHHYAPVWDTRPENIAYMFAQFLQELIDIVVSDHAASLRLYGELATLHRDIPDVVPWDVSPGGDRHLRGDIMRFQCAALQAIAEEAFDSGRAEDAIVVATKGLEVSKMLPDDDASKRKEYWEKGFQSLLQRAWMPEEERLSRLLSIRTTQAKARASRGQRDSTEEKEELQRIKKELETARAALKEAGRDLM